METYDGYYTGFPGGNIERWAYTITSHLPQAWKIIQRTVDPLIYAALVELLGSNTRFDKTEGNVIPVTDPQHNISGLNVTLKYTVPDFAGFNGGDEAVQHDQNYILQKCQAVPNISWDAQSVRIDTQSGSIIVSFTLPLA